MGKRWIPEDKFIRGKGTRRYVKRPRCAARYTKGGRAGMQCSWYAQEGRIYCARHGRNEGIVLPPEHVAALRKGHTSWWARMRELEKASPGLIRQVFNTDRAVETRRRSREIARTLPTPPAAAEDKTILRAHKGIIKELATLPAVPDKPFDALEPHEQLTVITGQSLRVVHQILNFEMKEKDGAVNLKVASMVKDTALRALAVRVKVDRNALTARKLDKMADLLTRLKAADDGKIIDQ